MIDDHLIVEKTYALYTKYGIKSISVDEIATMLGISKKTLYLHIGSRDELLKKVIDYSLSNFITGLQQAISPEKDVIRKLAKYFLYILHFTRKVNPSFLPDLKKVNPSHFSTIENFQNSDLYKMIKPIIEQGVAEGIFRRNIDIKYVYFNLMIKTSRVAHQCFPDYNKALLEKTIYRLILNDLIGITTMRGHQQIENQYNELLQLN